MNETYWLIGLHIPANLLPNSLMWLGNVVMLALVAIAGLLILVLIIVSITRRMINPLGRLARVTADIGSGRLDIKLPTAERNDEIGALTNDFRSMRDALKTHIEQLKETTAKQQKL